jgi:hypothetical protein
MGVVLETADGLPINDNPDAGGLTAALEVYPQTGAVQRITAGGAAPGQTLKQFSFKVALSASVTTTQSLYTVTAGKTFYATDIFLSHDSAVVIDTRIQAAGADIFRAPVKGDTAPCQFAGMDTGPQGSAGQALTVLYPVTAGPPNGYGYISGFES